MKSLTFKITILIYLIPAASFAFVSGPGAINSGDNLITYGQQAERGKTEPNENKASFQNAVIDIQKIRYARGLKSFLSFERSHFFVEYLQFASNKEQVGNTLFYDADKGSAGVLGFSADLLHDLHRQLGFYVSYSLNRNYNVKKFANPRLDTFAFGFTTAFQVSENLFHKSLLHFGSGDSSDQNAYLAVDTGFGYKLNSFIDRQATISASVFIEADAAERFDASYDAAFSPIGTQDRIRAFKYGQVVAAEIAITNSVSLTASHLQKLGGYDARATQITSLQLAIKF